MSHNFQSKVQRLLHRTRTSKRSHQSLSWPKSGAQSMSRSADVADAQTMPSVTPFQQSHSPPTSQTKSRLPIQSSFRFFLLLFSSTTLLSTAVPPSALEVFVLPCLSVVPLRLQIDVLAKSPLRLWRLSGCVYILQSGKILIPSICQAIAFPISRYRSCYLPSGGKALALLKSGQHFYCSVERQLLRSILKSQASQVCQQLPQPVSPP